jgi:hypothetical protein
MLKKTAIVKLTSAQAGELTGKPLSGPAGESPYLVRGLFLNEATGGFSIRYRDGMLSVDHSCLGSRPVPMTRCALVVFLKSPPKQVFVTCSMDE